MEFLNIPIFDDDFYKMIFRFCINLVFLTIIIKLLYYKNSKRKDYLFTFYMISTIVFFLCFTLKKYNLDIGMALGLFAIFGIIRYRTDTMPIKEMTYLFIVIGVSVINSLANKKMSYAEILAANTLIILVITIIEKFWYKKNEETKKIIYNNIKNIKPHNYEKLKDDLENKTGLTINKINIGDINLEKNLATITIYYYNSY